MSRHAPHNPFEFIPSVLGGIVGGAAANLVGYPIARRIRAHAGWKENPGLPNPDEISIHGYRGGYRYLRTHVPKLPPKFFDAYVRQVYAPKTPRAWFMAGLEVVKAKAPARQKCGCGDIGPKGTYVLTQSHMGEMCYPCGGKGFQTPQDIVRSAWWWAFRDTKDEIQAREEQLKRASEGKRWNPAPAIAPFVFAVGNPGPKKKRKSTLPKDSDLLRDMETPMVLGGYELDRETLGLKHRPITPSAPGQDYGADPMGDGTFRMVPSGDIVDYAERCKRLERFEPKRPDSGFRMNPPRHIRQSITCPRCRNVCPSYVLDDRHGYACHPCWKAATGRKTNPRTFACAQCLTTHGTDVLVPNRDPYKPPVCSRAVSWGQVSPKRRANLGPATDHNTRPVPGPRMQVKLPQHMVKGTITLREAIRRDIPGIRAAIKGFPKFHGSIDPDEEVIVIDDGRKDSVAGFLIGRAPEVVYDQVPNGSNKEGSIWVHKTSKEKPTYLVHIPQTGHSMLLGAMRVSDWLRG